MLKALTTIGTPPLTERNRRKLKRVQMKCKSTNAKSIGPANSTRPPRLERM